jgi:hypothetical protein
MFPWIPPGETFDPEEIVLLGEAFPEYPRFVSTTWVLSVIEDTV